MKNDGKQKYDITKLKSFQDITNIQHRSCFTTRRNFSGNSQSLYQANRFPNNQNPPYFFSRLPARIPRAPIFHTYKVIRKKQVNIKGKSTIFQFLDDQKVLFSAKFKVSQPFIPIEKGESVHFNDNEKEACVLYANKYSDYSLRNKYDHGEEIMSLKFRKFHNDGHVPRRVLIYFFNPNENLPEKLESKEPEQTDDMKFCIDLNTDNAIASIKNCRIEDSHNKPFIFIRKLKKELLEIEGQTVISPICLFTIGIGSFICKK